MSINNQLRNLDFSLKYNAHFIILLILFVTSEKVTYLDTYDYI